VANAASVALPMIYLAVIGKMCGIAVLIAHTLLATAHSATVATGSVVALNTPKSDASFAITAQK